MVVFLVLRPLPGAPTGQRKTTCLRSVRQHRARLDFRSFFLALQYERRYIAIASHIGRLGRRYVRYLNGRRRKHEERTRWEFKLSQRKARLLIAFAIGLAFMFPASAQAPYPSHPIRIVVPFGPGGFADITVRLLGQKLTERTGAQVVIENRPGAGGIIAASAVIASAADGYTLFVLSSGIALSKSLLKSMPFDPVTAFGPISTMALFDLLLLVRADSPLHTLKDALDAARANPQKFDVGTISSGSNQNVTT